MLNTNHCENNHPDIESTDSIRSDERDTSYSDDLSSLPTFTEIIRYLSKLDRPLIDTVENREDICLTISEDYDVLNNGDFIKIVFKQI